MKYIYTNLNPTDKKVSDCVIRSIMKATGKTWNEVFTELCAIGAKQHRMPNDVKVCEKYLDQLGFNKHRMPRFEDNTRYTVEEFANANPKGTYIIKIAHHLTVIVDGDLYDTWDCSYKSVGNYWKKV